MLISCFLSYKLLKNEATSIYFFFWKPKWKENVVQTAKCIVEGEVWGEDYKMQTIVYLRSRSLDGEATECRLCKHCACMLNTDYGKASTCSSEKIDPHADQNRKLTCVALCSIEHSLSCYSKWRSLVSGCRPLHVSGHFTCKYMYETGTLFLRHT